MDRKKNRWKYGIWSAFVTILGVLLAVILVWVAERATERSVSYTHLDVYKRQCMYHPTMTQNFRLWR